MGTLPCFEFLALVDSMVLTEEQEEEIQVLESIYADSFKRNEDDRSFSVELDTSVGGIVLKIKLCDGYPTTEIPEIDLSCNSHRLVLSDLMKAVRTEARGLVGDVMVFSLCTFIQDWVADNYVKSRIHNVKSLQLAASSSESEESRITVIEEKVLAAGTPVTKETFLAWREGFEREMMQVETTEMGGAAFAAPVIKESKLTGKQLFEQNSNLINSDAQNDGEDVECVNIMKIDESAFANLDLEAIDEQ